MSGTNPQRRSSFGVRLDFRRSECARRLLSLALLTVFPVYVTVPIIRTLPGCRNHR